MKTYSVPASVAENIARRTASQPGACIYGCDGPARLYPGGRFCDDHAPGSNPTPDPTRAAAALRDRGIAQVTAAAPDWERQAIDEAITTISRVLPQFSANDVRPLLPAGIRSALVGARFMAAALRREIRKVDQVTSTDPGTHGKPVAVWERVA